MPEVRTLTRRELFKMVWSTPMSRLAEQFGISDVGLKKICDRHRIPTPARGYWAKVEAGQKPKKAIFAETDNVEMNSIEIRPGVELPEQVREVIEAQREKRRLSAIRVQRGPEPVAPIEPVADVHPAVRKTARVLRQFKTGDISVAAVGEGLCGVTVGCASVERAVLVLDRLARASSDKRTPMVATGQAMQVAIGSQVAVFNLKERSRTIPHQPTGDELSKEAARQEQRRLHWQNPKRWPDPGYERAYPDKDTIWTGELSIQIDGDGVRRTWADGLSRRVEDLVPSIADGIEVLLAARKAEQEAREERARQHA